MRHAFLLSKYPSIIAFVTIEKVDEAISIFDLPHSSISNGPVSK